MSWSGGGFFGSAINAPARPAPSIQAAPANQAAGVAELDQLRERVRVIYDQGRLAEAVEAQTTVLARAKAAGTCRPEDFLFAGLMMHAVWRDADGIAILREAANLYPGNDVVWENLGVLLLSSNALAEAIEACEQALALGSHSANVLDCLAEAQQRSGRPDLAVESGRAALIAKDRHFGAAAPVVALPATLPPPFNPGRPEENVIAYTLWGNQPRYHVPLLENVRIRPHLFPAWSIRVYHDHTVNAAYLGELAKSSVQLHPMRLAASEPPHRALLWRFEVIADPTVRRFLVRDADSLLTVKERVAVDAWLHTDFHFHAMRDWYTHTDLLLAGMWGGVGGLLPAPSDLLRAFRPWRVETNHIDQDLLSSTVWPLARQSILIHDSIFQPCLGSVAFPPYGTLPPGQHIGENAFVHFSKAG
ncbi:MAG: hypothetical protein B7Z80_26775 [Rhodospirillales bacterium 20-64-7]|nr:MAG: hypothetical protein B7Z80_26775 [Rhodospirillales bacterium 20-64-7]HQT76309.1 tetratricopeptide repeat protein [Rhodopila sp.]